MAGHRRIVVRVVTWNLCHGRDLPLGRDWRRPLRSEFAQLLAGLEWDLALLQEAPPRWRRDLARAARAEGRIVKTSRNQLAPLRGWIAERWPDLIKSGGGGSNQVLYRPPWRVAAERTLTLARWPERRRMQWLRLTGDGGAALCVANLHASAHEPARAARELERAAAAAGAWSGGAALVVGGDFNVRPQAQPWVFERLAAAGFSAPTGAALIDHLLARGARVVEPARQLPPAARDARAPDGLPVRLSDHAPVVATFELE